MNSLLLRGVTCDGRQFRSAAAFVEFHQQSIAIAFGLAVFVLRGSLRKEQLGVLLHLSEDLVDNFLVFIHNIDEHLFLKKTR